MYSTVNPKQVANEVFCFRLCPVGLSVCTTRFMHSNLLGTAGWSRVCSDRLFH